MVIYEVIRRSIAPSSTMLAGLEKATRQLSQFIGMPECTYSFLHVVYAGYGDALYPEFTHKIKRRLIVIAGGFKVLSATSHQYAPYSEYFITAGQAMRSQMRQRALKLVYPTEDHK